MHLTEPELRRFFQGRMSAAELLAADQHLAACAACFQQAPLTSLPETVTGLQTDLALAEHDLCDYFSFDDKAALLDGELNAAEAVLAHAHLDTCTECCLEITELRAVKDSLRPTWEYQPAVKEAALDFGGKQPHTWRWVWRVADGIGLTDPRSSVGRAICLGD